MMPTMAAEPGLDSRFINKTLYKNIYPSTLNQNVQNAAIRAQVTPNVAPKTGATMSSNRRVVPRPTRARTATDIKPSNATTNTAQRRVIPRKTSAAARAGVYQTNGRNAQTTNNLNRRVIARSAVANNRLHSGETTVTSGRPPMSSQQCFANYKECMDRYCERADTAYNRCYCSAKLAQIDSKYQDKIDSLIQQIIKLQYNSNASSDEIKSYWDATIGNYTNTNPWATIDNALNIDWPSTESRVRGQNAFATGHSYCVNYLRSCSYMSSNLRDAYKSEIERDCTTYENGLKRIQMAAESVIQSYN